MKQMTDKQNEILKYLLIAGTFANTFMCLNLYNQLGSLEYSHSQLDSNVMSAIQTLSADVWQLKSSAANNAMNYSGQFD